MLLGETTQHPACFVAVEAAVGFELVTKDPLAGDNVGVGGGTHKIPRVVGEKGTILVSHSRQPVRVFESTTNGLRDWRWSGDGGDVQVETFARTDLAGLTTGDHLTDGRRGRRLWRGRG